MTATLNAVRSDRLRTSSDALLIRIAIGIARRNPLDEFVGPNIKYRTPDSKMQ
jgi:hypothetical protein